MAIFDIISHIRGDTLPCMRYIQNPDKTMHPQETAKLIRYMQSHAVETLMSVGYNGTSGDRELAVEQFRLAEAAYKAIHPAYRTQTTRITVEKYLESNHKKNLPPHMKPDADGMLTITKEEVVAEHCVVSFHPSDNITPNLIRAVFNEFMEHPYFRNFLALSNIHWNTDTPHVHLIISNFAIDGSRKLSLSGTKKHDLQRHLDKICYRHGLSIINSKIVRLDPTHAEWIDTVKKEGKITVWEAKNIGQKNRKAHVNRQTEYEISDAYRDYTLTVEENASQEKSLPENPFTCYHDTFVSVDETPSIWYRYIQWIRSLEDEKERKRLEAEWKAQNLRDEWLYPVYCIRKDPLGYLSELELFSQLCETKIKGDLAYITFYGVNPAGELDHLTLSMDVDETLQTIMNASATVARFGVRRPEDLKIRCNEVGAQIQRIREAIEYDQNTLSHTELVNAIDAWQAHTGTKEEQAATFKILASYGCNTFQKCQDLSARIAQARKRLAINQPELKALSKTYRDMKHSINQLQEAERLQYVINQKAIETYEKQIEIYQMQASKKPSLTALISDAAARSQKQTNPKKNGKEMTR